MEKAAEFSLNRGLGYSAFSGVIIAICIALYFFLSPYPEWEAFGAGLLAGGFLLIGPIAGFVFSAIVAGLVFLPLYLVSRRITGLPIFLLPIIGSAAGLFIAIIFRIGLENLILPVYFIFVFWGALGGFLFVFGAEHRKFG